MNLKVFLVCVLFFQSMVATAVGTSPSPAEKMPDEIQKTKDRIKQLEDEQRQLLKQLKAEPVPKTKQSQIEMAVIRSVIDMDRENEAMVNTAEYRAFLKEIRTRIEDCGTENFPISQGKKLYGTGLVRFTLDKDGSILSNKIFDSSGIPELDNHMLKVVAASAPFPAVPKSYYEKTKNKVFFLSPIFKFSRDQSSDYSGIKFHCKFK